MTIDVYDQKVGTCSFLIIINIININISIRSIIISIIGGCAP